MNGARAVALLLLLAPHSGAAQAALTPADSAILNSQPLRRLVLAPSVMRRVSLLAAGLDREVVLCLRGAIRGDTAVVDDFVMPDIVASAADAVQPLPCAPATTLAVWHNHPWTGPDSSFGVRTPEDLCSLSQPDIRSVIADSIPFAVVSVGRTPRPIVCWSRRVQALINRPVKFLPRVPRPYLQAPRPLDLASAAAIPEAYLTAFVNLALEAGLRRDETVLVHAGASGVGLAAIQVAKDYGSRVAATTRTAEKLPALTAAGADLAVDAGREDAAATIERRWGPDAVDIVLDPVGAATLPGDLRVLRPGGRVILLATLSGSSAELDIALLMNKRGRLIGSMLRGRSRDEKAQIVARFGNEILPAFETGRLRVTIDSVFPPERAAAAFQRMRENRNTGKILIDWSGVAAPDHLRRR